MKRREFLKGAVALAVAVGVPAWLLPKDEVVEADLFLATTQDDTVLFLAPAHAHEAAVIDGEQRTIYTVWNVPMEVKGGWFSTDGGRNWKSVSGRTISPYNGHTYLTHRAVPGAKVEDLRLKVLRA